MNYFTKYLGFEFKTERGKGVLVSASTFREDAKGLDKITPEVAQEIWERNKDRINDPKYDIDLRALFSLG